MNKFAKLFTIVLCTISISSCSTKQGTGALMGTVAGGLLGAQFGKGEGKVLAAGAGALLGAFAGSSIGKSMDEQDKKIAEATSQRAFEQIPSGQKSEWKNPDNGHSGVVTPTKTYKSESGRYCREYTQEVRIGDKVEKAYGTACRQPDGHWEIVRSN